MLNRESFSRRQPKIIGEDDYKKYSILIPLINTCQGISLLFEKRSAKLRRQPGEICFPGGKLEQGESYEECAIRETMEELLIDRSQIEVLGPGDIYLSPFKLILHPYIGIIKDYQNTYNKDEVAEIITIPLDFFYKVEPQQYTSDLLSKPPEDFPYEWIP
ncbi:MAG: CoA pyrophosphatase, partial [Clostridiales bacterium]|nr:CoA pyrophosphatase [Clostridiales bacterium]